MQLVKNAVVACCLGTALVIGAVMLFGSAQGASRPKHSSIHSKGGHMPHTGRKASPKMPKLAPPSLKRRTK